MKVYRTINKKKDTIYMIEHWDKDMRSFQLNNNMIFLINGGGDTKYYAHPQWKTKILNHQQEFLDFLNQQPYSLEIKSIHSIFTEIETLIKTGKCELTSTTY